LQIFCEKIGVYLSKYFYDQNSAYLCTFKLFSQSKITISVPVTVSSKRWQPCFKGGRRRTERERELDGDYIMSDKRSQLDGEITKTVNYKNVIIQEKKFRRWLNNARECQQFHSQHFLSCLKW
jgi:hypothetical protein